jgi:hypothetical protein
MNARTHLVTVTIVLALIGPTAAGAATLQAHSSHATIANRSYVSGHLHRGTSKKVAKKNTSVGARGRAKVAYNPSAYVPGGSSQKVAKAITAAGEKPSTIVQPTATPVQSDVLPVQVSNVPTNATTTSTDTVDACAVFESGCTDAQTSMLAGDDTDAIDGGTVADSSPAESSTVDQTGPSTVDESQSSDQSEAVTDPEASDPSGGELS